MDWLVQRHSRNRSAGTGVPQRLYLSSDAHGCPLIASCLLGRPFLKPRHPFLPNSVLDDSRWGCDEFAAVNSVCYGDPFDCAPHGKEEELLSYHRIPADIDSHQPWPQDWSTSSS